MFQLQATRDGTAEGSGLLVFDVPIASAEHVQVIPELQHHDVALSLLRRESALKDLDVAAQITLGSLKPNQWRGASGEKIPARVAAHEECPCQH
ncbi:hypothetical protein JMJ35_010468 [Cladonia borealis]|uniref:Uncharacterized protein n=1 Tax=Cladonia borealis TaxID=184061 RepID=A0AA39QQ08_9LECA|nr:hypothetical protein JMJ35_010468 [Cladonia borealis]